MTRTDRELITARASTRARRTLYQSTRWRRERREYLASHLWCVHCGARATIVDHVHGHDRLWLARFWDRAGWQALCQSCHSRKTMTQDARHNGCLQRSIRNGFGASHAQRLLALQAGGTPPGGSGENFMPTYRNHRHVPEKYSRPISAVTAALPTDSAQFLVARYLATGDGPELAP